MSLFDEMFELMDSSRDEGGKGNGEREGSLGVGDIIRLHGRNRVAADPAGWSFAAMEWWTTWLLLQRGGRVWKEDLRSMYDGTLFWKIREQRMKEDGWRQGYGWKDWVEGVGSHGTWKTWEVEEQQKPGHTPVVEEAQKVGNATVGEL